MLIHRQLSTNALQRLGPISECRLVKFRILYDLRNYIFKLFDGTTLYNYIIITFYFSIMIQF